MGGAGGEVPTSALADLWSGQQEKGGWSLLCTTRFLLLLLQHSLTVSDMVSLRLTWSHCV